MLGGELWNASFACAKTTAVVASPSSLSYEELRDRSLRLASYLVEAGLQRGERVAFCLPKCVELPIVMSGIVFAGCCYIPIDYMTPSRRIAYILKDSGAKFVVCDRRLARDLEGIVASDVPLQSTSAHQIVGGRVTHTPVGLRFSEWMPWATILNVMPLKVPVSVTPETTACILYTSGSTGAPKGVAQSYESLHVFVRWAAADVMLTPRDRVAQCASPAFDLSIFDVFASLTCGAALVLVPERVLQHPVAAWNFLITRDISVWYSVPAVLLGHVPKFLASALQTASLRRLLFAGEKIAQGALEQVFGNLPKGCRVSNWYGPTETNVCTFYDIMADDFHSKMGIPIGRACPYAQIDISSDGELLVSGPTVMQGYWGQSDKITTGFMLHRERKYYRTGDIVSGQPDRLFLIGRADRLLKVRGYRVQPEELELFIQQFEGVTEAAVVVLEQDSRPYLAAVLSCTKRINMMGLREHCAQNFPRYMIPTYFICVSRLPRNDRGKVDYQSVRQVAASAAKEGVSE